MKRHRQQPVSQSALRLKYLQHACYSFFRAATEDENLVSALHRIGAQNVELDLTRYGFPTPSPEEVFEYAQSNFEAGRLHAIPAGRLVVDRETQP